MRSSMQQHVVAHSSGYHVVVESGWVCCAQARRQVEDLALSLSEELAATREQLAAVTASLGSNESSAREAENAGRRSLKEAPPLVTGPLPSPCWGSRAPTMNLAQALCHEHGRGLALALCSCCGRGCRARHSSPLCTADSAAVRGAGGCAARKGACFRAAFAPGDGEPLCGPARAGAARTWLARMSPLRCATRLSPQPLTPLECAVPCASEALIKLL